MGLELKMCERTSPCEIRGGKAGGSDKERHKLAQNETDEHPPLLQEALYPCRFALSHQPNQPFLRHLRSFFSLSFSLSQLSSLGLSVNKLYISVSSIWVSFPAQAKASVKRLRLNNFF
jgi:hypothetical protein